MKKLSVVLGIFLIGLAKPNFAQQTKFRSGIFLHHSTGGCIWGPNGSNTSVPDEITKYNTAHGFTGKDVVTMTEEWWPNDDNEWSTWHRIFDNEDVNNDIRSFLQNNRIIVIKSCFPSSSIYGVGSPSDTLSPEDKTIYNYKWHWRSFLRVMARHPENFFLIWTNAPLVANDTNDEEARLSDQFCRWAKDTLAAGNDPKLGPFPPNVYVFDFFHKLVNSSCQLPLQYAAGEWDSHPNGAATELVAPQFVNEIFDAAIAYESVTGIKLSSRLSPQLFRLKQNYPNPFNPATVINFQIPVTGIVSLKVYDVLGREIRTLVNTQIEAGSHAVTWDGRDNTGRQVAGGMYFYQLKIGNLFQTRKALRIN